jgi:hypothetical protein
MGAKNWTIVAGNLESHASETALHLANSRESRAYSCTPDMAHRDRTAWLGVEDSNSEMTWQNIPLKGRRFPGSSQNSGHGDHGAFASAFLSAVIAVPIPARADEGGVSFWLPGFFRLRLLRSL